MYPLPEPTPSDLSATEIAEHRQAVNPGQPLSTRDRAQIEVVELQKQLDRAEQQHEHARDPVSRRRIARRIRELEAAIAERWPTAHPPLVGEAPPPGPDDHACRYCGAPISRQTVWESGGPICGRCRSAFRHRTTT